MQSATVTASANVAAKTAEVANVSCALSKTVTLKLLVVVDDTATDDVENILMCISPKLSQRDVK